MVIEVSLGTLTTRLPPVVVKSSVPTLTSIVVLPSVTVAGTGGPLVGVGVSSSTVVAGPLAPLFELEPHAPRTRARQTASGHARRLSSPFAVRISLHCVAPAATVPVGLEEGEAGDTGDPAKAAAVGGGANPRTSLMNGPTAVVHCAAGRRCQLGHRMDRRRRRA